MAKHVSTSSLVCLHLFKLLRVQAKDFELMAVSLVNPAAGRGNSGAAISSSKLLSSLITSKAAGMLRMLPTLSRSAASALVSAPSPLVQMAEMSCRSQMHIAERLYERLAAFHTSALDCVVRQRFLSDRAQLLPGPAK